MPNDDIRHGIYQHYKTQKLYELIGVARHSETDEEMIVYKALYNCEQFGLDRLWVRPKKMFFELLLVDGSTVPRFKWIK